MSTLALTQCWFTRKHLPNHKPRVRFEGAFYAHCHHCRRPIFSLDGAMWHIDGGFNVDTLGEAANAFLSVDDPVDGITLARIPIDPAANPDDIAALIEQIRKDYGLDERGNTLVLRDHRLGKPRPAPKRAKAALRGAA